uniref:Cystatin domain-containing protein n=1 Tax=Lygus hesperus TaxID=30085 RepID=A0A146LGS3_LYGHE
MSENTTNHQDMGKPHGSHRPSGVENRYLMGGFENTQITDDDRQFFDSIQGDLCGKLKISHQDSVLELTGVRKQIVAGVNYIFSFNVNGQPHEAKVWQRLPHVGGHQVTYVHHV